MPTKKSTNMAGTERLQVSIDPNSYNLLGQMARLGIMGRSHAEVATRILTDWLLSDEFDEKRRKLVDRKKICELGIESTDLEVDNDVKG